MKNPPEAHHTFFSVTLSYWGFTLSDGALRMLVLLHFFQLGYSPVTLAMMFVVYEVAGIAANLAGGWLAVRFGLRRMLVTGICLQVCGLSALAFLPEGLSVTSSLVWIMGAQGLCGVAKDFTKTAAKTVVKLTGSRGRGRLFRWIAWFTGSKNAMKGGGFFAGSLGLSSIGMSATLLVMAALLCVLTGLIVWGVPAGFGRASPSRSVRSLFSKTHAVNLLAAARIFMFGARDIWFVIGLPVFLAQSGWDFWAVGGFLAGWTIIYGMVQGLAPHLLPDNTGAQKSSAVWLAGAGVFVMITGALADAQTLPVLLFVLVLFCVIFALNSSLHSYLILKAAGSKKAAEDIGFYYAANATGRLLGTVLSGLCFQTGGLIACLLGAAGFFLVCTLLSINFARLRLS